MDKSTFGFWTIKSEIAPSESEYMHISESGRMVQLRLIQEHPLRKIMMKVWYKPEGIYTCKVKYKPDERGWPIVVEPKGTELLIKNNQKKFYFSRISEAEVPNSFLKELEDSYTKMDSMEAEAKVLAKQTTGNQEKISTMRKRKINIYFQGIDLFGETQKSWKLVRWNFEDGSAIQAPTIIGEFENESMTIEYEILYSGTLHLLIKEGETVSLDQPIACIKCSDTEYRSYLKNENARRVSILLEPEELDFIERIKESGTTEAFATKFLQQAIATARKNKCSTKL